MKCSLPGHPAGNELLVLWQVSWLANHRWLIAFPNRCSVAVWWLAHCLQLRGQFHFTGRPRRCL